MNSCREQAKLLGRIAVPRAMLAPKTPRALFAFGSFQREYIGILTDYHAASANMPVKFTVASARLSAFVRVSSDSDAVAGSSIQPSAGL